MSTRYVVGQPVVLTCTFTVASVVTDPTAISLTVTDPVGTATTYTYAASQITKTSTGIYTKTITGNLVGTWSFVWTGTGTAADVQDGTFDIAAAAPNNTSYCTKDEAKNWLQITDTNDDALLDIIIPAVSRWIEGETGQRFYLDAALTTRTFEATNRYQLPVDDIGDTTGLLVKTDASGDGTFEVTWSATDWEPLPPNAATQGPEPEPWTMLRAVGTQTFPLAYTGLLARRDRVQVTAKWGWPAVPSGIKQACLMMTARVFKRRYSPEGVAGFGDMGVVRVTREDVDVVTMLRHYRKGDEIAVFA